MFWLLFIAAALLFALSCTCYIVPQRPNLLFEFSSHFAFAYTVLGIGVFFLAILFADNIPQRIMIGVLVICILILSGSVILPYLSNGKDSAKGRAKSVTGTPVKVITANLLSTNTKRKKFLEMIKAESPDIIAVQELTPETEKILETLYGAYPYHHVESRDGTQGLGVYSKFPISNVQVQELTRRRVLTLFFDLAVQGQIVGCAVVHPPSPISREGFLDRNDILVELVRYVQGNPDQPVLMMGDFNITPFSPIYRSFTFEAGLKNSRLGYGVCSSYATTTLWPFAIPIDHVLHTDDFVSLGTRTGPRIGSDHFPVIAALILRDKKTPTAV